MKKHSLRCRRNHGGRDNYDRHRLRIAQDTLKMTDAEAGVSEFFGGMSKEEARKIVSAHKKHPSEVTTVR